MAHHSVFNYAEWVKDYEVGCDVKVVAVDNAERVAEVQALIDLEKVKSDESRLPYRKYVALFRKRDRLKEQKFRVVSEPKPKVDVVGERRLNAEVKLKLARSRLKRYENIVKKWEKKVKYYAEKEVKTSTGQAEA